MKNYRWFRLQSFWLLLLLPVSIFALHSHLSASEKTPKPATVEASSSVDVTTQVLRKELPDSLEELQLLEDQIQKHRQQMIDSTVAVLVDRTSSQGSGVVINEEGYILTAAHVISRRGIPATIFFADGTVADAETLGVDHETDAGVLRIVEKGKWAFSKMAEAEATRVGDWCVATGHPGGHRRDRPPVIRIGRVNQMKEGSMVRTDATLVGGDSGGPLFNLKGEVIGINSRIGVSTSWNLHVPVGVYHADWKNLSSPAGFLGVGGDPRLQNGPCRLTTVRENSPAAKAGLKVGDIIKKFEGERIGNFPELVDTVSEYPPETVVKVEVQRGEETLVFEVTLARKDPYSR